MLAAGTIHKTAQTDATAQQQRQDTNGKVEIEGEPDGNKEKGIYAASPCRG